MLAEKAAEDSSLWRIPGPLQWKAETHRLERQGVQAKCLSLRLHPATGLLQMYPEACAMDDPYDIHSGGISNHSAVIAEVALSRKSIGTLIIPEWHVLRTPATADEGHAEVKSLVFVGEASVTRVPDFIKPLLSYYHFIFFTSSFSPLTSYFLVPSYFSFVTISHVF